MMMNTCPVCASKELLMFDKIRDLHGNVVDILQCYNCWAIINTNAYEELAKGDLKTLQGGDFYLLSEEELKNIDKAVANADGLFDYLHQYVDVPRSSVFLDFGSGRGYVAANAARRFKKSIACERESRDIKLVMQRIGQIQNLEVVDDISKVSDPIDLLFMWHTLEHLPDPTDFWRKHLHRLSPECVFFLQIPLYRPTYVVRSHYIFYTERSLATWAQAIQVKPVQFGYDTENGFLTMVAKRTPGADLS
jgi:2-polyprenyl-3-methyl-5-hydroxy-6-metoxy-1,4-benzoquinol methylase